MNSKLRIVGRVTVLRRLIKPSAFRPNFLRPWETVYADNLVTTAGLEHYAARTAGDDPSNSFGAFELYDGVVTPALTDTRADAGTLVAGSLKRFTAGYPRRNDSDPDNAAQAGEAVLSYSTTYGASEANGTISGVVITNYAAGAPASAEPLLMHARFPGITKTAAEELKVIVNHAFA